MSKVKIPTNGNKIEVIRITLFIIINIDKRK